MHAKRIYFCIIFVSNVTKLTQDTLAIYFYHLKFQSSSQSNDILPLFDASKGMLLCWHSRRIKEKFDIKYGQKCKIICIHHGPMNDALKRIKLQIIWMIYFRQSQLATDVGPGMAPVPSFLRRIVHIP